MSNAHYEVVSRELTDAGIPFHVEHGGKHIHFRWEHDGKPRMFVIPASPSDRRGWLNSRSDLRRILKEDGVIGQAIVVQERPAISLKEGQPKASSLDVAAHFEKAHKDVLRSIDNAVESCGREFSERNFTPSSYVDASGRSLRCFDLSRDGFSLVAMGFTGSAAMAWKVRYIEAFNAMEAELIASVRHLAVPTELVAQVSRLEADLGALIELSLEATPAPQRIKKPPFVRPSVLRRMRRKAA